MCIVSFSKSFSHLFFNNTRTICFSASCANVNAQVLIEWDSIKKLWHCSCFHISMSFMIYNIILIIINQTLIYAQNFRMEKEIGGLATSFHFQFLLLGSFGLPLPTPPHLLETQIQETRSQEQEEQRDPDHVTVSVVTQYSKCAVI